MKKLLLVALGFAFTINAASDVSANPLARAFTTLVINQVVALVAQKSAQRDGIPPSDPRVEATQEAMSLVATEHAQATLGERMLMAAGAPTWFGLASMLLGAQLGEIAAAKIGEKDVTISSTAAGEIEVKHKWVVPAEKVIVPTYPGATVSANATPWAAVAAAGAPVYQEKGCRAGAECSLFPKESWGAGPRPDALYRGWFELESSYIKAYAKSWNDVVGHLRAYAQAALKQKDVKARNVRVDVPDANKDESRYQSFYARAAYEYESCKEVVETRRDFSNPRCSKEMQEAPDVLSNPLCTSQYIREECTWKDSSDGGVSISLPSVSRGALGRNTGPKEERRVYHSLDEAFDGLSDEEKRLELSPKFVADVANALTSKASQRKGYLGVPRSVTSPISPQDVKTLTDERGRQVIPRVVDVFSRPMDDYERVVPIHVSVAPNRVWPENRRDPRDRERPIDPDRERPPDPASKDVNVVNTPRVYVTNPVEINLGQAPDVSAPSLESVPTAEMILSPILGLLSDFRKWTVPAHAGSCPRPSVTMFQREIRMDSMCKLAEEQRVPIHRVMLAAFVLAALFLVLSA